jgi:hypothetical protein
MAWSSSERRVPAHCWTSLKGLLTSVGECRGVGWPSKRSETFRGSAPRCLGSWHDTQAIVPLRGLLLETERQPKLELAGAGSRGDSHDGQGAEQ